MAERAESGVKIPPEGSSVRCARLHKICNPYYSMLVRATKGDLAVGDTSVWFRLGNKGVFGVPVVWEQ